MKNKVLIIYILIAFIVAILIAGFILLKPGLENCGMEKSQEIVEDWIIKESSTYKFDGYDLSLFKTSELDCENCYEFVFWFNAKHAGYGDRSNVLLAQIKTPHTIIIKIENCEIISAIIDGKYDEIKNDFLESVPNIIISNPVNREKVKSPIILQGEARSAFEGEINFRLKEKEGRILSEGFLTIQDVKLGQFGSFQKYLIFPKPKSKEGILEVFNISAKDGSEENKESIEIQFNLEDQGLEIEIQREGEGPEVQIGDSISVDYIGLLKNGTKFDSSYDRGKPFELTVGIGQVIPGWDMGILGMKKGERRKMTIPSELAYGEQGIPNSPIEPGSTLIFEVELLEIK
ncbi:MAG: FKBP-type peptidyl-prolyl cis-trans isomerase [Patescibacteria group bacterium]|nr:FKBP-type peptidyl-prolyl cis-trans isomerase [Patescibacteria group bacterium]